MLGRMLCIFSILCILLAPAAFSQSQNGSISGQVTDNSGAVVPQAKATLVSTERNISSVVQTDTEGRYSFPSLLPGTYDLTVDAAGFKGYVQRGIVLLANQAARVDASLQVGDAATKVEVTADVAQLNFDNGAKQEGVAPRSSTNCRCWCRPERRRNAVQFVTLPSGRQHRDQPSAFNARINGGLKMGDEAVMDGVSMQEGTMSQSGMVSFFDFPHHARHGQRSSRADFEL